jgi:hypothetical protein
MSANSCSILARSVSRPRRASSRTRRSDVVIREFPFHRSKLLGLCSPGVLAVRPPNAASLGRISAGSPGCVAASPMACEIHLTSRPLTTSSDRA